MTNFITNENIYYPKSFNKLKDFPKKIYYKGDKSLFNTRKSIAIVGSRRMSHYGKMVVDKLVASCVSQNIATISGFMYGIDTEVHKKTLEYGGLTIAIMAGGLDFIYPFENIKLFKDIINKNGLIFSELKPSTKPLLWTFPKRNRLVAMLANIAVVVVEAGLKSGSLITAKYAKKFGKKLYAVPGPINSEVSEGTNYLIKNGIAKMYTSFDDVVKSKTVLNPKDPVVLKDINQNKIVNLLKIEAKTIDDIVIESNLDVNKVVSILSELSLNGIIYDIQGKWYLRN